MHNSPKDIAIADYDYPLPSSLWTEEINPSC